MKRTLIATAGMMGAAMMASLSSLGHNIVTLDRERPVSAKRRRVSAAPRVNGRSRYMPHQGAKERERAKRCWMNSGFNAPNGFCPPFPRSAPVMHQMSEREFERREDQRNIGRP